MNQSWSIIIFGYNEGGTISDQIENVFSFIKSNSISDYEILVVDDGSDDDTESIVKALEKSKQNLKYIRHSKNLGIGYALHSGYSNSKKENVIAVPADGQFDMNELSDFINFPDKTFVSFYRNAMSEYGLYRKLVTRANNNFNKFILKFDTKDVNWVKAYKRNELEKLKLELKSSLISSEICAKLKARGNKSIDVISVYNERKSGKSRGASASTISKALKDLLKLYTVVKKYNKNNLTANER